MKIEVLGPGCAKCKKLAEVTKEAVTELGVQVEIVKVEKITDIMTYGVMITPALVIDGEVKVSGRVPSKAEITQMITGTLAKESAQ
jgi:small redox-active disulfide protein 2